MSMSISLQKSPKRTNIKHNNREMSEKEKLKNTHIDYSRSNQNGYVKKDLKELYEREFGDALQKYNDKQKRADRKIKNYYEHIKASKKTFVQQEMIIQVGDKDDFVSADNRELARNILIEWVNGFQDRNPQMKVYNIALHDDEASPHIHLNFVPIADGYKRGLEKQVSFDKAMIQQNPNLKDKARPFTEWRDSEVAVLEKILSERGIARKKAGTNNYKDVTEYKQKMDLQNEIQELRQTNNDVQAVVESSTGELQQIKKEKDQQTADLEFLKSAYTTKQKQKKDLDSSVSALTEIEKAKEENIKLLEQKENDLINSNNAQIEKYKKELERNKKVELDNYAESYKVEQEKIRAEVDAEIIKQSKETKENLKKLKSEERLQNEQNNKIKADSKKYTDYVKNDLKLFSEEFLGRDRVEDYAEVLDGIEERLEPVKTAFGRVVEDKYIISEKDYSKLIEYSESATGFRDTLYTVQQVNKGLSEQNKTVTTLERKLDESEESQEKMYKQYEDELSKRTKADESYMKLVDDHNRYKELSNKQTNFINNEGLAGKFAEWSKKIEEHQKQVRQQNRQNSPAVKRNQKSKDNDLDL